MGKLSLMNYLKDKQTEDPNFFYTVQVLDEENRMTNFFQER